MPSPRRRRSVTLQAVIIGEFAATNDGSLLVNEDGDPSDWIELFNLSDRPVNLSAWTLTDDPDRPEKWTFDDIVIDPGQRLIVFASGKNRRWIEIDDESGESGYLHTNFKLSADPGFLALYAPTTRRYLDATAIDYPQQQPGISYGFPDGSEATAEMFGYLTTPSPGEPDPDNSAWQGMTSTVAFSEPSGLYEKPISLKLTSATPDSEIRFTLDGSQPTAEHGRVYADPIDINGTTIIPRCECRAGSRPGRCDDPLVSLYRRCSRPVCFSGRIPRGMGRPQG